LLVAGFFNKESASEEIIDRIKKGNLKNLWSKSIKKEAEAILSQIPPIKKSYLKEIKENIFKPDNEIKNPPSINLIKEDPEDNKFIECAAEGNADFIISNDEHLLQHSGYKEIEIVTPNQFLKR